MGAGLGAANLEALTCFEVRITWTRSELLQIALGHLGDRAWRTISSLLYFREWLLKAIFIVTFPTLFRVLAGNREHNRQRRQELVLISISCRKFVKSDFNEENRLRFLIRPLGLQSLESKVKKDQQRLEAAAEYRPDWLIGQGIIPH